MATEPSVMEVNEVFRSIERMVLTYKKDGKTIQVPEGLQNPTISINDDDWMGDGWKALGDARWYYFCVTYDNENRKRYLDGVLQKTKLVRSGGG